MTAEINPSGIIVRDEEIKEEIKAVAAEVAARSDEGIYPKHVYGAMLEQGSHNIEELLVVLGQ